MQRALAGGLAAGFTVIGVGGVLAPRLSARMFGIPTDDPAALAFVRAAAMRDVILGGIVFAALNDATMLRRVLGWASIVGLGDAVAVASVRGLRPQHVLHLGGFAALAALAFSMDGA
ncbi:MAG TPA: DUF4267 domain-containing protein [Xanthomonadales bacterium]|nr:DUF4267 domain-containing protein [Xanthomonadales bacterium]